MSERFAFNWFFVCAFVQIEESISIDILEELKDAFVLADIDGNGKLNLDEFKTIFKMQLSISDTKVRN